MTEAPPYCIGKDPYCPCQDGDVCHYRNASDGTKGWPVAPQYRQLLQELVDAIDFQCDPPGGDMSDAGWDQWQAASDTQYEEALKSARAALSAPLSPNSNSLYAHLTEAHGEDAVHGRCAYWLRLFTFKNGRDPFPQEVWDAASQGHTQEGANRDVSAGQSHDRGSCIEQSTRATDGGSVDAGAPVFPAAEVPGPDEKGNGAAPLDAQSMAELNAVANAFGRWDRDDNYSVATGHAELLAVFSKRLYTHTVGAPADSLSNPTESPGGAVQRPSGETER